MNLDEVYARINGGRNTHHVRISRRHGQVNFGIGFLPIAD
jgi:hypothetical protein